jgi:pilus assembly protein CpaE
MDDAHFRVLAVEPDDRFRTRLTIQLSGLAPPPATSVEQAVRDLAGDAAVLILGPGLATDTGLAQVQRLSRSHPEIGVILVTEELTLDLLQHALRSGVRDALTLEADQASLRQTIDRVGDAMAAISSRSHIITESAAVGKVVVAFSTKGGVGKSVVATNLAVAIAQRGKRAVLVDADLQFGDVAVLLGIPPVHTTLEAAGAISSADTQLMEGLLATHEASGLRVLPAPIEPSASSHIAPDAMVAIIQLLRTMFDYVIVDMPPHFDDVVLAMLHESDEVLLVASMEIPSIKNLKVGIQTLDLLSIAGDKMRLVLNRANAKVNLDIADVERALGVSAEFRIPSDISVPQAVNRGIPVVIDRPRSAAALAMNQLADAIAKVETNDEEPEREPVRRRAWRRLE